jgi:KDO2-lipid IV(A) lauroyltransferase|tara:strand:+ start:4748 stop:5593 length:846 start_codon:yes stop_codon:yes gene_type:complete
MKYSIIKVVHLLLKNLSIQYILFFAYPIGLIYYLITPLSNLKLSRRKQYIKNYSVLIVKINYVKYWLETIWLTKNGYFKYVYSNVKIINENAIRKLNKTHSSYILALPHVGNWEFAIPMGKELNLNLVAVAEPLSDIKILNWFTNLREELGCKILLGGKGQNTFSEIVELLNSNNHVCLLAERHIGKSGVGVEFFDQMAAFPKGPVALSLETQLPIVPTAFIKTNSGYELHFGNPFIVPYFDNQAQSIQHGLKVLSKSLENLIMLDPNQWHSIQPVWTSEY